RGDLGVDERPEDHDRNRDALAKGRPRLAARLGDAPLDGRAATRVATADHLPVAGQVADGLFVLSGLGGRGFCLAPLLAEHVVAQALGTPSPLPRELSRLVRVERFDWSVTWSGA
ncbi:MAG: FAD-dependent oxidoreductase, partial [bacterium]|nr:FAD-dependent oxidoreductase [bacterium]